MNLEKHFGLRSFNELVDVEHRDFDHVGGGALDWGVHGLTFGVGAGDSVSGMNIGEIASSAHEGLCEAFGACLFDHAGCEFFDFGKSFVVLLDEVVRFFNREVRAELVS